jgi:hypothetical protein
MNDELLTPNGEQPLRHSPFFINHSTGRYAQQRRGGWGVRTAGQKTIAHPARAAIAKN